MINWLKDKINDLRRPKPAIKVDLYILLTLDGESYEFALNDFEIPNDKYIKSVLTVANEKIMERINTK